MARNIPLDNYQGLVRGDSISRIFHFYDLPSGRYVAKAWLTVKTAETGTDVGAIFQKAVTTTPGADGAIEDDGQTTGIAIVRFDLTSANTLAMTAETLYWYDVQLKYDDGSIITPVVGPAAAQAHYTYSTT